MAGQTLFWDSRIRTIVVMLPALGVMAWIASEVASENMVAPLLGLCGFMALVFFTVFIKTVRFESVVLCGLLFGYLVGNRGFAELSPFRPFFPGELGLALIVGCLLVRFALTRELPDMSGWMARVIFLFLGFAAIRLLIDFRTYKLDAIRDAAMVYYSLYFFFGRQLVVSPASRRMLELCLTFAITALAFIALLVRFVPDVMISDGHLGLFFQKDDLMTTFAAVAIFVLYTRPDIFWWKWPRRLLILSYIVLIVTGVGRASVIALGVGCIPLLIAGKRKFLLYPGIALVVGLVLLAVVTVTDSGSPRLNAILTDKVYSIVDVNSSHNYQSEYGETKASTNEFRRRLWESFVDETNRYSPTFGRGFGYDFISHFEDTFQKGEWHGLRSAHNFYVTLYGRMGIIGLLVFGVLTLQIIVGGISAAVGVKAGMIPLKDLGYWCGAWAILMSSVVGVVLEGPIGAIVFWIFLGVAVETSKVAVAAQQAVAASRFARQQPVMNSRRNPLTYGAT